jgi:NAD(P)-dependent dehydrogenase (short-subunit alcohol dehydrogenase family)
MKPWYSLEGKKIWVTGGAGYLGSAITCELDRVGAQVLCFDLPGKAEALVKEHQLKHTIPLSADINDAANLPATLAKLLAEHGVPDGVVHLVTASSSGKRLEQLSPEEFQRTFDLALTPSFILCRTLAGRMQERGNGSIILFSSMYGVVAPDKSIYHDPMAPNPIDYGASKAATLQLCRYLAMHYGPSGVRFNCITPGPFPNTAVQRNHPSFIADLNKKTVLQRVGQNHEIVGPTLFLLTDSASFVTGHSLVVDGGWTIW